MLRINYLYLLVAFTANLLVVYTSRTYITASEPASSNATLQCHDTAVRCLTLNELIVSVNEGWNVFKSEEEVIFQSGVHVVNVTTSSLQNTNIKNLSLSGETSNVTVECINEFYFRFSYISFIKLSHITFHNCRKYLTQAIVSQKRWTTLIFEHLAGNLTLDNVQIKNDIRSGFKIRFDPFAKCYAQFINVKLSLTKLYITPLQPFNGDRRVDIMNTEFVDSCITVETVYTDNVPALMVTDTTFRSCNCESAMTFVSTRLRIVKRASFFLHNVNITDNKSPYVIQARLANLKITGHSNLFHRNKGAIYMEESRMLFYQTDVDFVNNTIFNTHGVPMFARDSVIYFVNCHILFKNNRGSLSGAIVATDMTQLRFDLKTTINFVNNEGENGGALSFYKQSVLKLDSTQYPKNIKLQFISNLALYGGGLFVDDKSYLTVVGQKLSRSIFGGLNRESNIQLIFHNNRAQVGGNQIYGGWIDWAVRENGSAIFNRNITEILEFINDTDVSSDPTRVCVCFEMTPNCSVTEHRIDIYGQAFSIDLVAVGQRGGTVTSFVGAHFEDNPTIYDIKNEEKFQTVQRNCTTLRYTMMPRAANDSEVSITLKPLKKNFLVLNDRELKNHPGYAALFQQLSIHVRMSDCPLGFALDKKDYHCICHASLFKLELECDSASGYRVKRTGHQWIGVTYEHTKPGQYPGVIAHQQCPFDYCRTDNGSLLIHLVDQLNLQCAHNRSGVLCGCCTTGFSKMLGSSKCNKCSNVMLLAAIPTFILSGLLLVIFLTLLNLTVSVGTINGLIFHVNILRAQQDVFFPSSASKSFLSIFIAWLNLDQGIEMCFYKGFDAYASTWLQYLFPLYIWFIAALMIVSSHYSSRISKIVGKNAVQVLATLFLLSYAKLLRLIIDVFSFSTITFPDGYVKHVWLIDGNIKYLKEQHLPLFLVTLVFIVATLPYTFVLLTIQVLYKLSHYRVMCWMQKLKPFFDAYTGPYKSAHRYWTGLLLVARIALLVTFAVNNKNNVTINLIAIIAVSALLLGWSASVNSGVYESPVNNFLEAFFFTNLLITTAAVLYNLSNEIKSPTAIYVSSSITLLTFIIIMLYHALTQFMLTKLGSKIKATLLSKRLINSAQMEEDTFEVEDRRESFLLSHKRETCTCSPTKVDKKVNEVYTCTGDDLNEPLLDD